jgi:hypothetical protein
MQIHINSVADIQVMVRSPTQKTKLYTQNIYYRTANNRYIILKTVKNSDLNFI